MLKNLEWFFLWSVLDSFGRIPQAMTQGNRKDGGTYDQCVNIKEKLDIGEVKGKYCFGGLVVPLSILTNVSDPTPSLQTLVIHPRIYFNVTLMVVIHR